MWNPIARSAEIIGPGLDALAANRPTAFPFANNGLGRYADLFACWDAQAQLCLRRVAKEYLAKRLYLATGDDLTDLARSEYETDRDNQPTVSLGEMILQRPPPTYPTPGVIKAGTRLARPANASHNPAIPAATYQVLYDTPVGPTQDLVNYVPIIATQPGAAANLPFGVYGLPPLNWVDPIFDSSLYVSAWNAAGGADSKTDAALVNEAYAYAIGQYGPTLGSIYAGALRGTGVRHAAVLDVAELATGQPAAYTGVLIADASWASSASWLGAVQQQLQDPEVGFVGIGPSVIVTVPNNVTVSVSLSVMLQDAGYLANTSDILTNIQAALTEYFNGTTRGDWYTFKASQIQAVACASDARIRAVPSATVTSFMQGTTLADPVGQPVATAGGLSATHYYLVDNGVTVSAWLPPS